MEEPFRYAVIVGKENTVLSPLLKGLRASLAMRRVGNHTEALSPISGDDYIRLHNLLQADLITSYGVMRVCPDVAQWELAQGTTSIWE